MSLERKDFFRRGLVAVDPHAPGSAADRPSIRQYINDVLAIMDESIRRWLSARRMGLMINVSETAASKISELLAEENKAGSGLRVFVQGGGCSGFQYGLMIEENGQGAGDQVFESHGVRLYVDPISVRYLKGAEVDFVDTVTGGGFTIKNPNATSTCGCGQSFTVD
jgi:iron-sulfur cluster assembly accessory protein